MAVWRSVVFQPPEAQRLADLAGVGHDLSQVMQYCLRFLELEKSDNPDWELLEIVCAAALIRYGRAFASGVRTGVPHEFIETLDSSELEWHNYLKAARDKWIAHSVNTFEENQVCAWLTPAERGPIGVYSVSVRQQRVATLSREAIAALGHLAEILFEGVKQAKEAEARKVLAIAQSLPPEPFYQQNDELKVPGKVHPSRARHFK